MRKLFILLLLDINGVYLNSVQFNCEDDLNLYCETIEPLLIANLEKTLPLSSRLALIPEGMYMPLIGRAVGLEVIPVDVLPET